MAERVARTPGGAGFSPRGTSAPLARRRVAVIGATGFIGSHLTGFLVRAGASVLAVARNRRLDNLAAVAADCRFAPADIRDRERLCATLAAFRPETVFHLAADVDAPESFEHMRASLAGNAMGTAHVLEAAANAGAETLVYADSCKVYGNGPTPYREAQPDAPLCSYAMGKAAGWRLCQLASSMTGMAVCSLRSTSAYGPRQNPNLITHVRDCARRGVPVRLMGGSQTRDMLYVDDLVRAFAAAAAEPAAWGHAIPVGGGVERTVVEICREVVNALGASIEVIADAQEPRLTEIWRSYSDNAEAAELLGWSPEVGLREGLSRTLEPAAEPAIPALGR
jgi:UDP-glucose 4-epimerase